MSFVNDNNDLIADLFAAPVFTHMDLITWSETLTG